MKALLQAATPFLLLALLSTCSSPPPASAPLPALWLRRGTGSGRLVVLLPGRGDRAADFARHGFALELARRGIAADVVAADAHAGYYADRSVVTRLHADLLAPARAQGYREIWLAGISLGGLGALLTAIEHPEEVDGLVLLAPFLGDTVPAEIAAAGGFASWGTAHILRPPLRRSALAPPPPLRPQRAGAAAALARLRHPRPLRAGQRLRRGAAARARRPPPRRPHLAHLERSLARPSRSRPACHTNGPGSAGRCRPDTGRCCPDPGG